MSVKTIAPSVVSTPHALTLQEATHVPANMDLLEMDTTATVRHTQSINQSIYLYQVIKTHII